MPAPIRTMQRVRARVLTLSRNAIHYTKRKVQAPSYSSRPTNSHRFESPANATHSIPGPSWLWLEPVKQPFRAYGRAQRRRPYLVQLLSSLTIYFLGDLSAQKVSQPANQEEQGEHWRYDPGRALRALTIGGISSIPSYRWFLWLGENFNYSSKFLSLLTKVAVNQVVFTPFFNSYFFGMQSFLTGASPSEVWQRIKNTVPTSWVNSCKLWPAVTAFSFTFVPLEYRSVFAGVIAIAWQTYLSMLNQRAAQAESAARQCSSAVDVRLHSSAS